MCVSQDMSLVFSVSHLVTFSSQDLYNLGYFQDELLDLESWDCYRLEKTSRIESKL